MMVVVVNCGCVRKEMKENNKTVWSGDGDAGGVLAHDHALTQRQHPVVENFAHLTRQNVLDVNGDGLRSADNLDGGLRRARSDESEVTLVSAHGLDFPVCVLHPEVNARRGLNGSSWRG